MNANDLTTGLTTALEEALDGEAEVTKNPADIRPALEDGLVVCWILPPHQIDLETPGTKTFEGSLMIFGPSTGDPHAELASIEDVAMTAADLVESDRLRFDSVALGNSPLFPAAEITYTTTVER